MNLTTEIIKVSCKGVKENKIPNQDHIQIAENNECLVVSVSDGLGSSKYSLIGAKLAGRLLVGGFENKKKYYNDEQFIISLPKKWRKIIKFKSGDVKDYRTTNSFIIVLKQEHKIITGRIGDVLIAIRIDGKFQQIQSMEKDFLNETDCLGSGNLESYDVSKYNFVNSYEFLIATDGIGDELNIEKVDTLFDYLLSKYKTISKKKRNIILKKEITLNLNDKNNDDKSLVFVWSN